VATLEIISDFVGKTIGNYLVEEKLGEGGFGIVYRGRHLTLDDRVAAIKLLKPEVLHNPTQIERFRNEARAAARVDHPGIVRIYDIGVHPDTGAHYIIMEYLRGVDLQRWLAPHREGLPLTEVVALLYDVSDTLDAVHDLGIIHRDLKPENLFRREDGLVKVLDLGIAKLGPDLAGSFRTATNLLLGSPGYFAPELADPKRKEAIDRRSDVFSLAAVAYELITHQRAWRFHDPWHYIALIQRADVNRPRDIRTLRPEVPGGWGRIIMAGMAQDPDHRPATAGAFVQALAQEHPQGGAITAQRAEVIRTLGGSNAAQRVEVVQTQGIPPQNFPAARRATERMPARGRDEPAAPTGRTRDLSLQPATVAPTSAAASAVTLQVALPENSTDALASSPDRVPTLVPALPPTRGMSEEGAGVIPEILEENPEPSRARLLDEEYAPSSAAVTYDRARDELAQAMTRSAAEEVSSRPVQRATAQTVSRRTALVGGAIGLGALVLIVRFRGAREATAPPPLEAQAPVHTIEAQAVSLSPSPASPDAAALSPDAAALPLDAGLPDAAMFDAATPLSTDAATAPSIPPSAPREPVGQGKLEVYANEVTDVFLVAGGRKKFLGTTPMPRATVPTGDVTLELRSRERRATRKVTVRSGRKVRVDHEWSN
jgi:serine/threonine protein kinase